MSDERKPGRSGPGKAGKRPSGRRPGKAARGAKAPLRATPAPGPTPATGQRPAAGRWTRWPAITSWMSRARVFGASPRRRSGGLDTPLDSRRAIRGPALDTETFGRWSEGFARFMGTASFIVGMSLFVVGWLAWNTIAPPDLQFDPRKLNYTLLTLILSLQASYAAPLILLAQNRQADRDRVSAEQDRDRAERALADTEYLAREVATIRSLLGDVTTRDYLRSELRSLLEEATVARKPKERPKGSRADRERPRALEEAIGSTQGGELPTETG